ncbi:hypothetical protein JHK86_050412 [Glycine max]|nr:hypothetical protein JHK86_050412 [Glycine max]
MCHRVASMSVSRNVKEKREGERRNTSHGLGVVSVAANPLGFVTASSSLDNFVRVFNVNSNATIATLKAPPFEVEVWKMHFDPKLVKFLLKQANVDKRTCDLFGNRDLMNIAHNVARSLKVSYKNSATALVKEVFVALHQLQIFTLGRYLLEKPLIYPPGDLPANSRAQTSGLDVSGPKPRTEVSLGKCS